MSKKCRKPSIVGRALIAAAVLPALTGLARAQSAEDFFKKIDHLTMYVGSGAGGGYDRSAHHMTRFLPGHPNIVIEDMPTAGGVVATNFLYNSAPNLQVTA
jgi:tripartite-type tricarboxylate transporter receptor subunit TctC